MNMIEYKPMVTIYTSSSCSSCRKVKSWFAENNLPFTERNIFSYQLKEEDIRNMLQKSENGTEDIISTRSKIIKDNKIDPNQMTINELINFIRDNPSVLKRPIIIDDRRMQVGYNEDEITVFIPSERRKEFWGCANCPNACNCPNPKQK